ncbi:MAG TPA: hypothetical protein VGR29_02060 [Thermomicrobiales bacterium]|nr:hypothetical protein [Thermomicrobiales bacterium]
MATLSTDPETTVAVSSIFGADGPTVLIFPCTESSQRGVRVKGAAIATWEAVDDSSGHFTAVQVIANVEGDYMGTLTIETFPSVDEASSSFEDNRPDICMMFRDASNAAVAESPLPTPIRMLGYGMTPGDISFDSALDEQPPRTLPSRPGPRP